MKISNPELKKVLLNILIFDSTVDEDGNNLRRKGFKKELLVGVLGLKKALLKGMQLGGLKKNDEQAEVEWIDSEDDGLKAFVATHNLVAEKYADEEVELTENMLKALKHYYNECEELPEMEERTLEQLEELVK